MDPEAFFKLSYGIYLISSGSEENPSGYIANTAFQVTAEPPQIAISCHKQNASTKAIEESKVFNLSVLEKETDAGLIGLFGYQSGLEHERFERIKHKTGKNGAPVVLTHANAYFECEVVDRFDLGSHYLFVGKVTDSALLDKDQESLTYDYFRNEMKLMAPERAPTYIDKSKISESESSEEQKKEESNTNNETTPVEDDGRFICPICAYVYDPEEGDESQGIPAGTPFEELPEDWLCPICAAAKSMFISEN